MAPTSGDLTLDHLMIGSPDLAATVEAFAAATGVTPVFGGSHPGWGTCNYLVGLGDRRYLEFIGKDPDADIADADLPFGLGELGHPRFRTWALRSDDLDAAAERMRAAGLAVGPASDAQRDLPDGTTLRWRLTAPLAEPTGMHPFTLEWEDAHPADPGRLPEVRLHGLTLVHPAPDGFAAAMEALGVRHEIRPGDAEVVATVETERGPLALDTAFLRGL